MALDFPELGQPAPDFTTQNQREEDVSLSDLKGRKSRSLLLPKSNDAGLYCSGLWPA